MRKSASGLRPLLGVSLLVGLGACGGGGGGAGGSPGWGAGVGNGINGSGTSTTATTTGTATGTAGSDNSSSPDPTLRETTLGLIQGTSDAAGGTLAFKGIPYAKPPVGDMRWRAPADPAPWQQTLAATRFGNACLQNGRMFGPGANNTYDATIGTTLNTPVGSEDCLTLNVWRPSGNTENLPVIVFVYGGSNISGYTADPVYDGANLAKTANAVVVTVNYRLGPLGFFNAAQLKAGATSEEGSGNFALLDLIQALKFVKSNAARFGGNPGNVTLMGQSAGAVNVWALVASPLAAGLFNKAVPISGGISLASNLPAGSLAALNPPATYAGQSQALLARLLIADGRAANMAAAQTLIAGMSSTDAAAYLRGKDAKVLLTTQLANGLTGSGPIADGTVLPADPIAAIAAGRYNRVPVLAGTTDDEGKLFASSLTALGGPPGFRMGDAARFAVMMNYNPDAPATTTIEDVIDPFYLPATTAGTGWNARSAMVGNALFSTNRDNVLNTLKTQQSNVWHYQFKWAQQPAPWNTIYGAVHGLDLLFIFGNFGPSQFANVTSSTANKPGRQALSNAMMASIAAFARNGDPNTPELGSTWAPWPARMNFDATAIQAVITAQ